MQLQQEISKENLEKMIGKTIPIMIEAISHDQKYYIGRSSHDVPEIDGMVYLKKENQNLKIGDFTQGIVKEVSDYDLICESR